MAESSGGRTSLVGTNFPPSLQLASCSRMGLSVAPGVPDHDLRRRACSGVFQRESGAGEAERPGANRGRRVGRSAATAPRGRRGCVGHHAETPVCDPVDSRFNRESGAAGEAWSTEWERRRGGGAMQVAGHLGRECRRDLPDLESAVATWVPRPDASLRPGGDVCPAVHRDESGAMGKGTAIGPRVAARQPIRGTVVPATPSRRPITEGPPRVSVRHPAAACAPSRFTRCDPLASPPKRKT